MAFTTINNSWGIVPADDDSTIYKFRCQYGFLSNMKCCSISINNQVWTSSESLYQAISLSRDYFKDPGLYTEIILEINKASAFGSKILAKQYPKRNDWNKVKEIVMYEVVRLKFFQNATLAEVLLDTKDKLIIEGNYWHDNYWGQCFCGSCKEKYGHNYLGIILMSIRDLLLERVKQHADMNKDLDIVHCLEGFEKNNRIFPEKFVKHLDLLYVPLVQSES